MFGKKKKGNYSYPLCPKCEKKGALISQGSRQCLTDQCEVALFWMGGHSVESENEVEENTLHETKENTMDDVFRKYQKKNHLLIRTS